MTGGSKVPELSTGIAGLDDVLHGGLPARRIYVVEGSPGAGKTTLALRFLLEGARNGERTMYVTLSETADELRATAASHGWDLGAIELVELPASPEALKTDAQYTMFHPSEVELSQTTRAVLERAEAYKPQRLVFDSLSEFRLLAQSALRYRRQILALKQFFLNKGVTVLFADDRTSERGDTDVFSLAHGVISLDRKTTEYGSLRRYIQVVKLRGKAFREGCHDMRIVHGGLEVYPRLVSAEHRTSAPTGSISSELPALDALVGGGLTNGTSTLILGPAGTGKSSLAAQYAAAAARRGERAAIFLFEELHATYVNRCAGLGLDLRPMLESGRLEIRQIDPAELSPGEFTHVVRHTVKTSGVKVVVIDTLNGYLNAMPSEKLLLIHMHELLAYLGQVGVCTILISAQHGLLGDLSSSSIDMSYLADMVILTRYFEVSGEVRQAVSIVKKRSGAHERTIRELSLSSKGIEIGEPLKDFIGVLGGRGAPVRTASRSDAE